jgi:phosphatidate cytidylyltransferase
VSDLRRRSLTALVVGPLILSLFVWLPPTFFLVFVAVVLAASVHEFSAMAQIGHRTIILVLVVLSLAPLYLLETSLYVLWMLCTPAILLLLRLGPGEASSTTNRDLAREIMVLLISLIFLSIPLFSFYQLKELARYYPVVLLLIIWGSDTMAYLLGKNLGKHKLAPAISPKKTTEGLVGAILGAVLVTLLFHDVFGLGLVEAGLVGCAIGILGQLGDMLESVAKRVFDVKDSSALFPGHGGILDRIDSFLLTAPFLYYYLSGFQR